MLFKEFAGVDALPLCLATKDPDEIVATVKAIAPGFGGINLEDIPRRAASRSRGASRALDIPVFHDDQHGTAVVMWRRCSTPAGSPAATSTCLRALIIGVGAAGVAVAKILRAAGVRDIVRVRLARRPPSRPGG